MTNYKSMLLVKGVSSRFTGNSQATFKMIPLTLDCPYMHIIFNPQDKILGIVGKQKKNAYDMFPSLDKAGTPIFKKGKLRDGEIPFFQERRLEETFNEYEILTKDEIIEFVKMFAINADTFDIEFFFKPIKQEIPEAAEMTVTVTAEKETTEV